MKLKGILTYCLILITMLLTIIRQCSAQDGIPERSDDFSLVNVCSSLENREVVCEAFAAPEIVDDFGEVQKIFESPIEANRVLNTLPSFGLAKWHWWLFGDVILPRAQRQYSDYIGGIKLAQRILNQTEIDSPASPFYARINAVREYHVPFEPIQRENNGIIDPNIPPTKQNGIAHAAAAIDSINVTVENMQAAKQTALAYETYIRNLIAALQDEIKQLRRRCGRRCL